MAKNKGMTPKELTEKQLEAADPNYVKRKRELNREMKQLEARKREIELEIRKLKYAALPEDQTRLRSKLGMNPYDNRPIHRSMDTFMRTGSFYMNEEE